VPWVENPMREAVRVAAAAQHLRRDLPQRCSPEFFRYTFRTAPFGYGVCSPDRTARDCEESEAIKISGSPYERRKSPPCWCNQNSETARDPKALWRPANVHSSGGIAGQSPNACWAGCNPAPLGLHRYAATRWQRWADILLSLRMRQRPVNVIGLPVWWHTRFYVKD